MSGEEAPQASETGDNAIAMVTEATEELYRVRDTYFPRDPADKTSRIRTLADTALARLDSVPVEQRKSAQQRAMLEFLKGKILDVFPDYNKEAEDHLSKAVKLNPSLVDAWLCLGNCIWKKGDLVSAKNCFTLALSKGPNKKVLCQLSMLERSMSQVNIIGQEDQATLVDESIKHAKEAAMLDIKDGNSWYNLGNAYLTSFFVYGACEHTKLQNSLKAYQNAEKDELMNSNPDLSFNCATAHKYLENYERALHRFEAAASQDPSLGGDEEVRKIISVLDKLDSSVKKVRNKKLTSMALNLGEISLEPAYRGATVDSLSEGINTGVAVLAKVLLFIKHDNIAPLYCLLIDSNMCRFILSVFGLQFESVKEGDCVTLLAPNYREVDVSWKGKHCQFKLIRVDFAKQILINGRRPSLRQIACTSMISQNKS
ncbi:Tetratricopeptide repeat protein 5 [Rhynchospora pubera]|uniref:Tetratricopeptide repeat protein 5 n=1 Tax=Rhynchospora pubera TaxID=906938 RepID=A0AAV8GLK5_9POAL|nr:Tetratricopeptide repeat protein 5 [Rhynchospora pubera]